MFSFKYDRQVINITVGFISPQEEMAETDDRVPQDLKDLLGQEVMNIFIKKFCKIY